MKPIILYDGPKIHEELMSLKHEYPIWKTIDIFEGQLNELFEIERPQLIGTELFQIELKKFVENNLENGCWIYYPWSGILLHTLKDNDLYRLRTNRNRNLITEEEQKKLREFTVGVIGLSVGSNIALSLVYQGIANQMKLADFDSLETSNLNRIRARLDQITKPKTEVIAEQIYEVNPFADLTILNKGLTKDNINDFVNSSPKPDLIFEIIDNFEMKILLRKEAKKAKVPVIMMANLGDSILVDIERYDENSDTEILNGLLGDLPQEILNNPHANPHLYAVKMVGDYVPKRALESVKLINKTLVGRPQLSSTVTISGGLAAYFARKIALNKHLPSGRRAIKFHELCNVENDMDI